MNRTPTDAEKTRQLPWIVAADASNSVFAYLTFFGSPFILMLSLLGLPKTSIGALMSLLPFFGVVSLVAAPYIAHFGFKRAFVLFFAARKVVTLFLLFTPLVASHWGPRGAFIFIAIVVGVFALFRALAETASYPWSQEMIPNAVRGKFTALDYMCLSTAAALALVFAGWVIGDSENIQPFMILVAVGLVFGGISVWCTTHWVGGEPLRDAQSRPSLSQMWEPLRDRNFVYYEAVVAVITLAGGISTFLPLYQKDAIGLSQSVVVWLQIAGLAGMILTAYAWGWVADRFGARPVLLIVVTYLFPLPGILWFMLPRYSVWSTPGAAFLAFLSNAFAMGWALGTSRLLFANLVPADRKTQYMAMHYAWMGLIGGCTPLLAGVVLDAAKHLSGHLGPFVIDQYSPLWAANAGLIFLAAALISRIRTGEISVRKFAGLFLHGNPLLAAEAIRRHGAALEEETRISAAEMMGRVKSPLYIEELIQSLHDPSYNVRHEAIVSIAHMPPDDRLVDELAEVLHGRHPDLAVTAAWALGRLGPTHALEPLRAALHSDYPMVAAAAARTLGTLRDRESQALILERFQALDPDSALRTAYAAALGNLRCRDAVPDLLAYVRQQTVRAEETTLALARIIGGERRFIRLWRQTRSDFNAGVAQAIGAWRSKVRRLRPPRPELDLPVTRAHEHFMAGETDHGLEELRRLLVHIMYEPLPEPLPLILGDCAHMLEEKVGPQDEVLLLALHGIGVAFSYMLGERSSPTPAP